MEPAYNGYNYGVMLQGPLELRAAEDGRQKSVVAKGIWRLKFELKPLEKEAEAVETAVKEVLKEGYRTVDIMSEGCVQVSCSKMGDLLVERVRK